MIEMLNADLDDGTAARHIEVKVADARKELATLDRALERAMRMGLILDDYETGKLESELARIRKLRKEQEERMAALERQLATARRSMVSQLSIRERCAQYAGALGTITDEDWVVILRELGVKVVIGTDQPYEVHAAIPVELASDSDVVLQPSRTRAHPISVLPCPAPSAR